MENPKTILQILEHHLRGGKFEYLSVDYKSALDEFKKSTEYKQMESLPDFCSPLDDIGRVSMDIIPKEIKEKHKRWRSGKLRKIDFHPTGTIYRAYVGAKYARPFYDSNLNEIRLTHHDTRTFTILSQQQKD